MRPSGPALALTLTAVAASFTAPLLPSAPFGAWFGPLPAPLAMAVVAGLALVAAARLQSAGWAPADWPALPRLAGLVLLGAACALPTPALDIALPFPAGINAALPEALVFYPVIGVAAETLFHLLPFALLSLVAPARPVLAIVACALVEPAFQVAIGGGPALQGTLMVAILFGFGLVQMATLHRHGFIAAYALRFGYYLVWHIAWGAARLPLLFSA